MLFPAGTLEGIQTGRVTLAFRRWERPRVKAGGRQRTGIGVIGFEAVEAVAPEDLTEGEARAAGFESLATLLRFIGRRQSGTVYRIRLVLLGPDPRVVLRETVPDDHEVGDIEARLERLDRASHHGAWTHEVLRVIGDRPGTPAIELAASFRREKRPFKADVRKLKELGLTESLRPGYRLSPRGRAVLARIGSASGAASPKRRVERGIQG